MYVIFEDGTDIYWARTRVLEYLSKITPQLPQDVKDGAGPGRHQRGLGVPVRAGGQAAASTGLDELRSYQDWFLRYAIQSVPGVAEVATVGGQVRQYQVTVNPNTPGSLRAVAGRGGARGAPGQQRRGGRLVEVAGPSTWCAAAAT